MSRLASLTVQTAGATMPPKPSAEQGCDCARSRRWPGVNARPPPDFPLLHAALSVPPCHLLFSAASSSPSRWVGGAAANAPPASVRRVSARGALSSGRLVTPLRVEPPDRARCAAPKGRWRRAGEKIHVFVDLLSVLRDLRSALPAKLPQ